MAWIEAPASHAKAAGNSDSPGPDATAPVLDSISTHAMHGLGGLATGALRTRRRAPRSREPS